MVRAAISAFTCALLMVAADVPKAAITGNPIVNLSGRITRVDAFRPGQGMPALVVDVDGTSIVVLLGSMRYLMEQNFNPKAGAQVHVKAYKLPEMLIAIQVKLPADGLTLDLRDENGRPLWRGGGCSHCGPN